MVFCPAGTPAPLDDQRTVAAFVDAYNLEAPPAFRLLDLVSEVGEVAKDANTSTEYGETRGSGA